MPPTFDIYSPEYLAGIVADLKTVPGWATQTFFKTVRTFTAEAVDIDIIDRRRRLAPFVSPFVRGRLTNAAGFATRQIKPAYIKDERPLSPDRALKRIAGEQIGGAYTPEERLQLTVPAEISDQVNLVNRREEVMIMEQLRTGHIIISGEDYPTTDVDLQRQSDNTIDLTAAGTPWTDPTAKPLDDLQVWALIAKEKSGVYPRTVAMGTDCFRTFVSHVNVKDRWQAQNAQLINIALKTGDALEEAATRMGTVEGFEIWVYADWYVDPLDDQEKEILPHNELLMASPNIQGVRNYGAIRDMNSLKAEQYFVKSYEENNPSLLYLLLQSAPLPAMERPNASIGATVMAA